MPLRVLPNGAVLALLLLAAAGLADATYLAVEHYRGAIPSCGAAGGCETVLTSRWAAIGPVPVALLGSFYYGTVFLLAIALWDGGSPRVFMWLRFLTSLALAVTLGLLYLQAFVIHHWCLYCLFSAAMTILLFAVVLFGRPRVRQAG